MAWVSFKFGRPGSEYTFEVPPEGMSISPMPIKAVHRNLAGDMKKSILKTDCPIIKINSSFLSLTQRNQFASLMGVGDTFLSFICRDDWQIINDLVSIIDLNHIQLNNNSALRLSAAYVNNGLGSLITITTPFIAQEAGAPFGTTYPFGGGPFGIGTGAVNFDPGAITYDDLTGIITMANPLPSADISLFVTYTYPGWLVEPDAMNVKYQGGWLDRGTYDISLSGA